MLLLKISALTGISEFMKSKTHDLVRKYVTGFFGGP
jgi:hypothetical protein